MTADYALGSALECLTVLAWISARLFLQKPVLHAWLGSACCALVSTLTIALTPNPDVAPIAHLASNATGIMTGYLFARGVRFEVTGRHAAGYETILWVAASLAISLAIALAVPSRSLSSAIVGFIVGLLFVCSLFWAPPLVARSKPKMIGLGICALVAALGVILAIPLAEFILSGGVKTMAYPDYKGTYVVMVLGMVIFVGASFNLDRRRRSRESSAR